MFFLLAAVLLRAVNQAVLKKTALILDGPLLDLITSIFPYLAILILVLRAYFWQKALVYYPLSLAYPFTGLTFLSLLLIGYFLFDEPVTAFNVVGVVVIMSGVLVTVSGMNREKQ